MYIVICYDISSNKRRTKLYEMLLGYGTPVQRSVFECDLSLTQFEKLIKRMKPFAKKSGESIRYYSLCSRCKERVKSYGINLLEMEKPMDIYL
ncbi:MAG: CRISPR-associated endonuclease Cas2 [Dehalococcoidales bacterium]|nr:CRISPR-associated endonuclease Cas2 [Dehalococcoidales bacterium]